MRKRRFSSHLGLLFIIAVVLPSVFLALIAIRAINREEAYIEKRLEGTLLTEAGHVVILVNSELEDILEELKNSAPGLREHDPEDLLYEWNSRSSLVSVPFILSPSHEILWPRLSKALSAEEVSFLDWNREFFANNLKIPVYYNIALAYKDEILNKPAEDTENHKAIQQALSQFEQNEAVRSKVYKQAKEKGQAVLPRTVSPSAGSSKKKEETLLEESIFISESLAFSDIIEQGEFGIIPRLIDDKLTLLFWKREKDGFTVGCVIEEEHFRKRIIGLLPVVYSSVRILTILDEHGLSLITPQEEISRDWQRPFIAREISELLPRWEVAAYLTDPDIISSQANFIANIMWLLIFILIVSISGGGAIVLKVLHSEITLARQKTGFVTNVSHEFKTPLTSIRMFAEMLKERPRIDEKKRGKYLDIMISESERLTHLINNVLDFSRMDQGKKQYSMKKVDIVRFAENLMKNQKIRLKHNGFDVRFTVLPHDAESDIAASRLKSSGSIYIYEGNMPVYMDEEAVGQAILNLISNAEKYSDKFKKIDIEVSRRGDFIFIDIEDRGIGISAQQAKKIFREFYRVDDELTSKVRGTGLGLTITRRIIQDHGGDVHYFPREGGGSTFRIKLPIA